MSLLNFIHKHIADDVPAELTVCFDCDNTVCDECKNTGRDLMDCVTQLAPVGSPQSTE